MPLVAPSVQLPLSAEYPQLAFAPPDDSPLPLVGLQTAPVDDQERLRSSL